MARRRKVLVSTSSEEKARPYVEALQAVGIPAEDIRIVEPDERDAVPELAEEAAGLVLCGGIDVAPERYGEETLPDADVEVSPERDELEWRLMDEARKAELPVWAICRGVQLLNVYLGGSLWQDLPSQRPGDIPHSIVEPKDAIAHPLEVLRPDTPTGQVLAREPAYVNSRHHQAIKDLADGLVPVARSADGLIEAVELDDPGDGEGWWVRGVQWHPENLIAMPQQRELWEEFARAVQARKAE